MRVNESEREARCDKRMKKKKQRKKEKVVLF